MSAPSDATEQPPDLTSRALGGMLWLTAGNGVRAFLKIAFLALLGRLLTPAEFGVVGAAMVVVWLSMLVTSLGVGPALVQRESLEARHVSTGLVSSVALGILMGVIVWWSAPIVATLFRIDPLAPVLRALALLFPIGGLATVAECLLQRRMRFRAIAMAELVSYGVGYGGAGVTLAWMGYGVWALVGAEMAKSVIKSSIMLLSVPDALRFRFDPRAFAELFGFGSGYTLTALTTFAAMQGDKFIVARFLGATSLGLYARAYELMLVPAQALGVVLDKVLFPAMSRLQDDRERLRQAYGRGMALVALLVLPASGVVVVLAPEIVLTLLGDQWNGAVAPFRVLTIAMYFRVGYMVGHAVANATGNVHRLSGRNAAYAALVTLGALVGHRWGLTGLASGVALAVTVNFVMIWELVRPLTGLTTTGFLAIHAAPLRSTMVVTIATLLPVLPLRSAEAPAVLVLMAGATAAIASAALFMRIAPSLILGAEGRWLLETLRRNTPAPLRPLLSSVLSPGS